MRRVYSESVRLLCPDFANIFVRREALQRLQPLGTIIGHEEALQMLAKLVLAFIVIAFDRRILDCSVHSLDLTVCPRMIDFGQSVFNSVFITDPVEYMASCVFVTGLIGELNTVVGEHRVDPVGKGLDKVAQEVCGNGLRLTLMEFHIGQFRGSVDGHEQIQLSFFGAHFGNINMNIANRIFSELLFWLAILHHRKARDAVTLETPM